MKPCSSATQPFCMYVKTVGGGLAVAKRKIQPLQKEYCPDALLQSKLSLPVYCLLQHKSEDKTFSCQTGPSVIYI
jgi:hypothetical protein